MAKETFAIIGGDQRSAYAAQFLIRDYHDVKTAGLELCGIIDASHMYTLDEAVAVANYIILPLPLLDKSGMVFSKCSGSELDAFSIINSAAPDAMLFAGRIPETISAFAKQRGKELYDYYLREELQIMNAVPTAEGTAEILMKQLPTTLFDSNILVTGFGRTAQALCAVLRALGTRVTVAARKPQALAHARSVGCRVIPISRLPGEAGCFDAVVNTVPARVITAPVLDAMRPWCFVLDIASAPGGVDTAYALKAGISTQSALSLPGRVAPKSAGKIIVDTVLNIIQERGHRI